MEKLSGCGPCDQVRWWENWDTTFGRKASASVIVDEPCTLFYLPAKKLEEVENNAPEIASALHKFIVAISSERLIDSNDALQALIHSL